jgi:hypothetical protein
MRPVGCKVEEEAVLACGGKGGVDCHAAIAAYAACADAQLQTFVKPDIKLA